MRVENNVYDRLVKWDRKKNSNIDNWRRKIEISNYEECKFQPEIHENKFKFENRKAEDVVINPEAFNHFLNRNLVKKKEEEGWKKILDKKPGTGAIYINKPTIPQNVKLCTSKFDPKEEKLKMEDFLHPKNKRASSEYNKTRLSMDSAKIEQLIKQSKEDNIRVKIPMRFDQAKDYLRSQLYSLKLN